MATRIIRAIFTSYTKISNQNFQNNIIHQISNKTEKNNLFSMCQSNGSSRTSEMTSSESNQSLSTNDSEYFILEDPTIKNTQQPLNNGTHQEEVIIPRSTALAIGNSLVEGALLKEVVIPRSTALAIGNSLVEGALPTKVVISRSTAFAIGNSLVEGALLKETA